MGPGYRMLWPRRSPIYYRSYNRRHFRICALRDAERCPRNYNSSSPSRRNRQRLQRSPNLPLSPPRKTCCAACASCFSNSSETVYSAFHSC